MQHRNLTHQDLTLAAIDDVISRGGWQDWVELRLAALSDSATPGKIARVQRPVQSLGKLDGIEIGVRQLTYYKITQHDGL